ncbi:NAD-dependent dehydratase [Haloprofundus marisrubri]|uniref:NAD-dependent dehydratase n=1 Tax=Haloprofundus marisrubri TaxID=1514971 RepID=A0A0W1R9Q3_9EURY|nr:SDR family oxidoreductase [Haloprofundus marisrubri]KTG10173.1 NAD-dependent dehydratase [Haloprofundus marisrubri]
MRILVPGSHGGVGKRITDLLSNSDHEAVAMVRDEAQVSEMEAYGVEVVVADLTSDDDVERAVRDCDAILFAAGSNGEDVEGVDRDGAIRTIDAAEEFGASRYVMLSAMNADEPESSPEALRDYLEAKAAADEYLRESSLDYTIVRPGALTNDDGEGTISAAEKLDERGEITRDDVAETLVTAFEVENTEGKTFEILAGDDPIETALENLD